MSSREFGEMVVLLAVLPSLCVLSIASWSL
jgi:hypothetical protein